MRLVIIVLLCIISRATIKSLGSACMCDITNQCDQFCCCDKECAGSVRTIWNNYEKCASDGYSIPFCTSISEQPMHKHDLYQGLRLIYTIVKRLFCISRVNFVDSTSAYVSSTSDGEISSTVSVSAVNPAVSALKNISTYSGLPLRNNAGICTSTQALRDMNGVNNERCGVFVSSAAAVSTNGLLSASAFLTANSLATIKVYQTKTATSAMLTPIAASSVSTTCTVSGSASICTVIKYICLIFKKDGTSVTLDTALSYLVVGQTQITSNSYIKIRYSYIFEDVKGFLPYSSNVGYTPGSPLILLNQDTSGNYYKVLSPVNLQYRNVDGSCRTSSSTTLAGQTNLVYLSFGVNAVFSCVGATSKIVSNLQKSFVYVGMVGSTTSSLSDYVKLQTLATVNDNLDMQLVFYYVKIGTQNYPQYRIVKAKINQLVASSIGQPTLYVEYQEISVPVIINVPNPPILDAYLPDDFLYPFYVG